MMKRIVAAILAALLLLTAPALANRATFLEIILNYEAEQAGAANVDAWLRDVLPGTMGMGGEWYAFALAQQGYELPGCLEALDEYLRTHTVRAATSRLKFQLVRKALGGEVDENWHGDIGAQGVMSWAWGLHLITSGCEAPVTAQNVIARLLALQLADGGWANSGAASDPDVTAMVLQALAPYKAQADVAPAIERALIRLDELRLPDGGYASYGVPCPESAAQVAIARMSLGLDDADLLYGLQDYRLESGGYSHTLGGSANPTATMQVFLAYTAYQRQQAGRSPLYVVDAPAGHMTARPEGKVIAAIAVAAVAGIALLVLLATGRRRDALAVLLIAAVALAALFLVEIESADDYYAVTAVKKDAIGTVTLAIRCDTVAGRAAHIPADGVILPESEWPIAKGDTVFALLTDAARANGLLIESSGGYVSGVNNLYEFDFGPLSGWIFFLNGEEASQGSGQYVLQPGDRVEWRYTLQLGRDL